MRNAFNLSVTITEKIRNFRIERISKILIGNIPINLHDNPITVLHIIPLISFNPAQTYDITFVKKDPLKLPPIHLDAWDNRYNLDGVLTFSTETHGKCYGYVQFFKNGIIEATDVSLLESWNGKKIIPSVAFERELIKSLSIYLNLLKELSIQLPYYVFLSILNVKGYTMPPKEPFMQPNPLIDREHLLIQETIVDNSTISAKDVLHSSFDSVWNACGISKSRNYDKDGNWIGR